MHTLCSGITKRGVQCSNTVKEGFFCHYHIKQHPTWSSTTSSQHNGGRLSVARPHNINDTELGSVMSSSDDDDDEEEEGVDSGDVKSGDEKFFAGKGKGKGKKSSNTPPASHGRASQCPSRGNGPSTNDEDGDDVVPQGKHKASTTHSLKGKPKDDDHKASTTEVPKRKDKHSSRLVQKVKIKEHITSILSDLHEFFNEYAGHDNEAKTSLLFMTQSGIELLEDIALKAI